MNLRVFAAFAIAVVTAGAGVSAQGTQGSPLTRARQAYNAAQFDASVASATEAARTPALVSSANLVAARARLERFRAKADAADLSAAHDALNRVEPARLSPAERLDYTVGLGIAVYFEGRPGAAAELFETLLDASSQPTPLLGDRRPLFDWWATAVDRAAQLAPDSGRRDFYLRILTRSQSELARDPLSTAAGYWLAAAARGAGELDRAWHAAIAAWIRSRAPTDRVGGRADLDHLVITAIIPERARSLDVHDAAALAAAMRAEWEQIKTSW